MNNEEILEKWENGIGLLWLIKDHDKMDIALFLEKLSQYIIDNKDKEQIPDNFTKEYKDITVIIIPIAIRIYQITDYVYDDVSKFIVDALFNFQGAYNVLNKEKFMTEIGFESECTAMAVNEMIVKLLKEKKIKVVKEK